jgi:hypothetical protein
MATEFSATATEMIISSVEDVAWLPEMMLTHKAHSDSDDEQRLLDEAAQEVQSLVEDGYVLLCRDNWSGRTVDPMNAK